MGMIKEFKEFALNGNMVDMAVGIIMGGAIGSLVTSMIENLINPIVGLFMGGVDLSDKILTIGESVDADGNPIPLNLNWGSFLTAFINFLILAFVIFMIAKAVNNAKKRLGMVKPPGGPSEVDLLTEIRDALAK